MNSRIPLKLSRALDPKFRAAFDRLCADPATPKQEAWALARTKARLTEALATFQTAKAHAIKRHGTEDPTGWKVPKEKQAEFFRELEALLDENVELYLNHRVLLPSPLPPDSKLTIEDLCALLEAGIIEEAPHADPAPTTP